LRLGCMGGVIASVFTVDTHLTHSTNRQYLQRTLQPDGSSIDSVADATEPVCGFSLSQVCLCR